ncbi:sulfonate ABC transporter substrate-binding protein [Pseudomonas putida]|uniref:ABC transporter substrate-binding protein n=1 Tax=Pseudomonas putida TaxID=303 RepID=UPI00235D7B8F|nr:ABC transporter substrate-binding protein [Pseudomonas putida]GLO16129.1 sulfonate ABC transporter substrate-binding protein [Pseudomonas putida]HDS0965035.1 ABC transporter substrate-binding protein [Pseudomonas putida]HDS0991417.1 ABC transporter substrate-binding protein [Pseudomonas putida]
MAQVIRVGSHPMNFSLFILRRREVLEPIAALHGWDVEWVDYTEGRDSARLLADGKVDWVGTGSTPPIYAQNAGLDVAYVGATSSRPQGSALLVKNDSVINEAKQLKGIRVASTSGSYTDHFLATVLLGAGLSLKDIQSVDLPGRRGQAALLANEVDVWAALDPLLTEQLKQGDVRSIAEVGSFIPNRSMYWARQRWLANSTDQAATIFKVLQANDEWIASHVDEAAAIIARDHEAGIADREWATVLSKRSWEILPANSSILKEQYSQARTLFEAGWLSRNPDQPVGVDLISGGGHA